jgi:hypothetical protein
MLDRIFSLNLHRMQLRNMDIIQTYTLYIDRGEIARSETHIVLVVHPSDKLRNIPSVQYVEVGGILASIQCIINL